MRNPPLYSFPSFSIVVVMPFCNSLESSIELTIFIMSLNSSFDIASVAVPEPRIFSWIPPASAVDAAVNPVNTLLSND